MPLGRAFSYAVPPPLSSAVQPGVRVLCGFGRRKVLGVVLSVSAEPPPDIAASKLKPILAVFDREPALGEELLSFLLQLSAYYLAPIGEVLRLALPSLERSQVEAANSLELDVKLATVGRLVQFAVPTDVAAPVPSLSAKAQQVLQLLRQQGAAAVGALEKELKGARAALKKLEAAGLVRLEKRQQERDPFFSEAVERDQPKELNERQRLAAEAIASALGEDKPATFLLQGVTGSGKTEVYLHAVARCLELEGGAIVLVPEIALTPQLVARFRARFGDRIAVLHSGLSEIDRVAMWRRLRTGELRVAVGARSALFAPLMNLRLLCVDEEHDSSFKQEEGVRYHARDMALLRAHRAKAVTVLGSATPSLASIELANQGRIQTLLLPDRARESAVLPQVEIIDLRRMGPGPSGNRLLSLPLHRAIEATLERKEQTILFLNRRGFAPSIVCDACGEVLSCPNCSVALTAHRSGRERACCHYCDYAVFTALECAGCGSKEVSQEGTGTERVEEALCSSFPQARVARLDRDVAQGLKSEKVLNRMRDGTLDILIGTQMVTKGHDLPDVTLVGVLNADAALSMPDYQATERTFQLLVQVAGRAGRGHKQGRVLIQTRNPEHEAIRCAITHNHRSFVEQELRQRREAGYPPFRRLIMVRVDALDENLARTTIERLAAAARQRLGEGVELLGPSTAPLERLRNRYRFRFLLRARKRRPLYELAHRLAQQKVDARVRVHIDIDPVNML